MLAGRNDPQAICHVGETHPDAGVLDLVRFEAGAVRNSFFAIIVHLGKFCKSLPDLLLAHGMYVFGFAEIDYAGHSALVHGLGGEGLCFAQFRPVVIARNLADPLVIGYLCDIEGEIIAPEPAPVENHRAHKVAVAVSLLGIGFSLIPDCALDCERCERLDHCIVKHGDEVRFACRGFGDAFERNGERNLPFSVEAYPAAVGPFQIHEVGGSVQASVTMVVGVADADYGFAGLDLAARHRVFACLVPDAAAANHLAVPVSFVEVVDGAKAESDFFSSPFGRDLYAFAEPVDAIDGGPQFLHFARKRDAAPCTVVETGLCP